MEPIRILCYGDSNTWGYISGSNHQRYGVGERWTSILAELLGNKLKCAVTNCTFFTFQVMQERK